VPGNGIKNFATEKTTGYLICYAKVSNYEKWNINLRLLCFIAHHALKEYLKNYSCKDCTKLVAY
jgi:hypothetical protein